MIKPLAEMKAFIKKHPFHLWGFLFLLTSLWSFVLGIIVERHWSAKTNHLEDWDKKLKQYATEQRESDIPVLKPEIFHFYEDLKSDANSDSLPNEGIDKLHENRPHGEFYVQVAASTNLAASEDLVRKLTQKGFPCDIFETKTKEGRALFRVRAGPYATKRSADEIAHKLAKHDIKGFVVNSKQ